MSKKITIEVEVPEFDVGDADGLRAAVIAAYVAKYERALADVVEGIPFRDSVGEFDAKDLRDTLRAAARDQVLSTIRERVDAAVSEVVGAPFIPTDRWGSRKGEPMTLRDLVATTAETWFSEKVDDRGNRTTHYDAKVTRADFLARSAVAEVMGGTLKTTIDGIKAQIAETLKARVADEIAGHVAKLLGGK